MARLRRTSPTLGPASRAVLERLAASLARKARRRILRGAPVPNIDPQGYLATLRDALTRGAVPGWQDARGPAPGALVGWDGRGRLALLHTLAEQVLAEGVEGDFVEAGVWRGGTSIYLAGMLRAHQADDRSLWALDSFRGCPSPEDLSQTKVASERDAMDDWRWAGEYVCSKRGVQAHFEELGLLSPQVNLVEGWFHETLPTLPAGRVALLHVDADLFTSTYQVLTALYPRISSGGYVVLDDYGFPECRRAVERVRAEMEIAAPLRLAASRWPIAFWKKP